jgi:hypothetical protein
LCECIGWRSLQCTPDTGQGSHMFDQVRGSELRMCHRKTCSGAGDDCTPRKCNIYYHVSAYIDTWLSRLFREPPFIEGNPCRAMGIVRSQSRLFREPPFIEGS